MKKMYKMAAALVVAGALLSASTLTAKAAEVPAASVLSGNVATVAGIGTTVKEGDVLATVNSLAGPIAAVRATVDGIVKTVLVQAGEKVQQGTVVIVLETK